MQFLHDRLYLSSVLLLVRATSAEQVKHAAFIPLVPFVKQPLSVTLDAFNIGMNIISTKAPSFSVTNNWERLLKIISETLY